MEKKNPKAKLRQTCSPEKVWEVKVGGYEGWLVQDRLCNGLAFGGFRFGPKVSRDEVCELAQTMTWKLAAHDNPVGGAKAGFRCDPQDPELPKILKEVAKAWSEPLSTHIVVGKDMGATDLLLDSLYQALEMPQLHLAQTRNSGCPNKIREMTGYLSHMTALGAVHACTKALGGLEAKKVAIQGAGAVGIGLVHRLTEQNAKIIGICDIAGSIISKEGLPQQELLKALNPNMKLIDRTSCEFIHESMGADEILNLDLDVLFLAANSGLIDENRARRINAPVVVEVSNFGVTPLARIILQDRGILVIPDVIASSSSAALCAHQLASGNGYSKEAVWQKILGAIEKATLTNIKKAKELRQDVRSTYIQNIEEFLC